MMRAMVVYELGEPAERLQLSTVPIPKAGPGQVVVKNLAIGCNFPDMLIIQGRYQVKPPLPFSPGLEVCGLVTEVGEGVSHVRVGDRVLALMSWGGYAEYSLARAPDVFVMPEAMSADEGAAFGVVFQTTYAALVHRGRLRAGETLLVHAAAGGVGLAAVQLGKALGARVIATAGSAAKLEIARAAGADVCLDYRSEDWIARVKDETKGEGANVVYDPVGGDTFDGSTKCIASEGRILVVGFAGGRIAQAATNRVLVKNFDVIGVHWGMYRQKAPELITAWMQALFALVAAGKIRSVISARFPLAQAADALAFITGRESYGKVVLTP